MERIQKQCVASYDLLEMVDEEVQQLFQEERERVTLLEEDLRQVVAVVYLFANGDFNFEP